MTFSDFALKHHYADGLKEHLDSEDVAETHVHYELPNIQDNRQGYKPKTAFTSKPKDVRLPARLASPLIPYPQEIKDLVQGTYSGTLDAIHGHHTSQLASLHRVFKAGIERGQLPPGNLVFDMDSLKRFARQKYSSREDLINLSTLAFAKRATRHDLSCAATEQVDFNATLKTKSRYTAFIIMIQRLRVHISKHNNFPEFDECASLSPSEEATYTMYSNGVYLYRSTSTVHGFCLMSCGGHFRFYHAALGYWFCGPSSYLDYVFTIADIMNNLDVLSNCTEYAWANDMFGLFIEFSEHEGHHKDQVDFMKTMEGFFLNMSDYDEDYAMNWKPLLEATRDLWELDQRICNVLYDPGIVLLLLRGIEVEYPRKSFFCRFVMTGKKLERTHLQEISALHKLIFYAEVSADAGVKKFLKRVHTPRKMDRQAIKNITRYAKMAFLIAYKKKHKSVPNLLGPVEKTKLLDLLCSKQDYERIEGLPLSWWDDVRIYDCMDNTLTDDPLEFAKDKGALKSSISFGPGDSRKELLQVIEREDYELKDFFAGRNLGPVQASVERISQLAAPVSVSDPARLIEKEREQKWEARLFANAELENKHSLSLITARMKKVLAYFDEQLMTPTDQKRKSLIHEASRLLADPNNYSLLLDIEGHNQSMQYDNTHELAEFMGNLFGQDDWGGLGHYFSQLTVYHYDEYLDCATVSRGQLGGIEGWLNPLWTLHTTIMMKLLRTMTDLTIRTIMVYSDDVDAVVEIRQASEPMVKSVFTKIIEHCSKFGMTVKYSQTNLSKHRITMLRQHYADGIRADSTLKRLISVSAGNNPVVISDELEVAGICSSASSALELSNHHEACCYLKNYKLGLLLCRLPQMILSRINQHSMISPAELPEKLSNLLYYSKDDAGAMNINMDASLFEAAKNDIRSYLRHIDATPDENLLSTVLSQLYGVGVAETRLVDSPDRLLYMQMYDEFLQDLLFFWCYLPCSVGGLGASLHLNLMLSGHSIGTSKSLHYLHQWCSKYASDPAYFLKYLEHSLGVNMQHDRTMDEKQVVTSTWPGDKQITSALTSLQQSIKNMVHKKTKNRKIREMFELSDDRDRLASDLLELFRDNFHGRVAQFYHENTSVHFIDLLINKIETSSGLIMQVPNITRLRNSLSQRAIDNIRMSSRIDRAVLVPITRDTDIIETLLERKCLMFPKIKFVKVEEILYDDKIGEVDPRSALLTVRRCAPTHYRDGRKVYDDPKVGNEVRYKGELLDDDRMLGNKEELLAAKLVAVTKWLLTKHGLVSAASTDFQEFDAVKACNLALSTLTNQTFSELMMHSPTEVGGEILHRIPNIRFSTSTYIRAEMNLSLRYTTELSQAIITQMGLVDSNVNFDYVRMRYLVAAMIKDKYPRLRHLVTRYGFSKLTGIHDVQFLKPERTRYNVTNIYKSYSSIRSHDLSVMRFRYLSRSYLYDENVTEWALIPKLKDQEAAGLLGNRYIDDIIIRYARDLDKDYMLVSPRIITQAWWKPLCDKLNRIDPAWRLDTSISVEDEIRMRLERTLQERSRITLVDKSSSVSIALQTEVIASITMQSPDDIEYVELSKRYLAITRNRRHSSTLASRLAQYQALLQTYEQHRQKLALALVLEYIATFHFKTMRSGGEFHVDSHGSCEEFFKFPLGKLSFMPIDPELQTRMVILGIDYLERFIAEQPHVIIQTYANCCDHISLSDIITPTKLPTLSNHTSLQGTETVPQHLEEIEYVAISIPNSAVATLDHISPLCRYAHQCSVIGASPLAFSSCTGSDSLGAQLALFRQLINMGILDARSKMCDLTAGRGDGLYAAQHLGLTCHSFARDDTFTRLNHHPAIDYGAEYDIFNGATLKFVTAYDFVHVDVSFTGDEKRTIMDLVFFLEENNIAYSIRLNSVKCSGYDENLTAALPSYDHFIAYATNADLKPYHIYLIGMPGSGRRHMQGPELKDTIAFRSMALAFSRLLSRRNHSLRLEYFQPNSASIYLPTGNGLQGFINSVCDNSVMDEQRYYLGRYLAEVGSDSHFEVAPEFTTPEGNRLLNLPSVRKWTTRVSTYGVLDVAAIGNVSEKARPYHEEHVRAFNDPEIDLVRVRWLECPPPLLEYYRTHHPLSHVRSCCNVLLGLAKFCRGECLSGHHALERLASELNHNAPTQLSMHQRELSTAIKLLVLASRSDSYVFGIEYCHKLLASGKGMKRSLLRILQTYRLLSYLYPYIHTMMARGQLCIQTIDAISNELEVREPARFKYLRKTPAPQMQTAFSENFDRLLESKIDDLFTGFEQFVVTQLDVAPVNIAADQDNDIMLAENLSFDLRITDAIEAAIESLQLRPSGPHGFIDLGDDDFDPEGDW